MADGAAEAPAAEAAPPTWESLGLDPRVAEALQALELYDPLPVQARVIPLVLQGRDVLCQSFTGSGKSIAYIAPLLHGILQARAASSGGAGRTSVVIVVPTRELTVQLAEVVGVVQEYFASPTFRVTCASLSKDDPDRVQRLVVGASPDIVVTTPSLLVQRCTAAGAEGAGADTEAGAGRLDLSGLRAFVCDEADLVLSMSYADDMARLAALVPAAAQKLFFSATLDDDVAALSGLFLADPVTVRLGMADLGAQALAVQHYVEVAGAREKFLLLFGLIKLQLIRGYTVIFVNTVHHAYRVGIFLYRFGVRASIFSPEMPQQSRQLVIDRFNLGTDACLVAVDGTGLDADVDVDVGAGEGGGASAAPAAAARGAAQEAGVFRGLDFTRVDAVINFDAPQNLRSYTHRNGRTNRGRVEVDQCGHVLTMLSAEERQDAAFLARLLASQRERYGVELAKGFSFDLERLAGFRYRVHDVLATITPKTIRDFRLAEVRSELLASEKLREYFAEHSRDLQLVRTAVKCPTIERQRCTTLSLKSVPAYLLPSAAGLREETGRVFVSARGATKRERASRKRLTRALGNDKKARKRSKWVKK